MTEWFLLNCSSQVSDLTKVDPDLPYRLRNNFDLNTNIDWQTVFGGNEKGYTDFPVYEDWKKA